MIRNVPMRMSQNDEMYRYFESGFESDISGIRFEIYRTYEDPAYTIDPEAFDDVYHLGLTTEVQHINPEIQSIMDCMRTRIIDNKELAGRTVKIVIPSTPDYCIDNLVLVRVEDRVRNSCTQSGAGLPKIEFELLLFKPFSEQYFYVTAGDLNANSNEELNELINQLLMHEALHRFFYDMGVMPRENQDEQFVEYLELVTMLHIQTPFIGPVVPNAFGRSYVLQSPFEQQEEDSSIPIGISFSLDD